MTTNPKPDEYSLESTSGPAGGEASEPFAVKPRPPDVPRPADVEPLPVEDEPEPPRTPSIKDLDVCPNCGAAMRDIEDLVCIRCGFDLKTMKKVKTVTGEVEVAAGGVPAAEEKQVLVKPGNGGYWLPGGIAAISGLILLIAHLAGAQGLFHAGVAGAAAEVGVGMRLVALLQLIVLVGMLTACALGALAFLAQLLGMRFVTGLEDLKLAAMRMLGIVLAMRLAALISLPQPALEWTLEAIIQLAVFAGLSIALFRLKPRDAPTLTGAMVILFVILWGVAKIIMWATGG